MHGQLEVGPFAPTITSLLFYSTFCLTFKSICYFPSFKETQRKLKIYFSHHFKIILFLINFNKILKIRICLPHLEHFNDTAFLPRQKQTPSSMAFTDPVISPQACFLSDLRLLTLFSLSATARLFQTLFQT